jgi:hypothetical protein
MHKSVITFGVLITSLVMLAIVPLLNQNNNAAMAQGYDNSYGDSYYSQYPTDDKKYECRTGPFEGFIVSSVEFCDAKKFDDKDERKDSRDNRTGGQPPTEPPTATLTVKKQVFGCDNFQGRLMKCKNLQNNSPFWLNCNDDAIDHSIFCLSLPESIFDIEVLDEQMRQIQQFKGSEQGTTIGNLGPGLYRVNEIKHDNFLNQLGNALGPQAVCVNEGRFSDGGDLFNQTSFINYLAICFKYVDEQGNDCNTISLAAGEERTCIVKNYIRVGSQG